MRDLAVGVDPAIDQALQDQLGQFILQSCHCGIEGHGHFVHVCWHIGAKVLPVGNKKDKS